MSTQMGSKPCTVVRRDDLDPICPHCESAIPEIYSRRPRGPFGLGRGYVFFCPHCKRVLGFGTMWYPFMVG